jgi:hypothetical protein
MSDRLVVARANQPTSGPHSTAFAAWALAIAAIALTVAEVWLANDNGTATPAQLVNLTLILVAIVGATVAARLPSDPTGWILLAIAFVGGLGGVLWDYGYRAMVPGPESLPLGQHEHICRFPMCHLRQISAPFVPRT